LAARRRSPVRRLARRHRHGVSILPHSAPIEVISTRQAMRAILASTGYPYLVLRLGTIDAVDRGPTPAPRLPADQIIERS
jgi:hypothetical protein